MQFTQKAFVISIATIFSLSNVGCGQGFRSTTSSAGTSAEQSLTNVTDQLAKAQAASLEAQKAMDEANSALAEIMDENGEIHLNLFSSSSVDSEMHTAGLLSPLIDKLNGVFDTLFAKAALVKKQFNTARALLADAAAKLDPVLQAVQLQEIKEQLAKIDALERTFSDSMHSLAGKLDLAVSALDKLINLGTSFIPIPGVGAVAGILIDLFLTGDVKDLIASVKLKLLAL